MSVERGAVSIVLLALIVVGVMLGAMVIDVARYLDSKAAAATAADAAALAAAPVTFRPFGARGSPRHEAASLARTNGAVLAHCHCPLDPSFEPRTVVVEVSRRVDLLLFGARKVSATARARFDPRLLAGPQDSGSWRRYNDYSTW